MPPLDNARLQELEPVGNVAGALIDMDKDMRAFAEDRANGRLEATRKLEDSGFLPKAEIIDHQTNDRHHDLSFTLNGKSYAVVMSEEGKVDKIVGQDGKVLVHGAKVSGLTYNPEKGELSFQKGGAAFKLDIDSGSTTYERDGKRISRDAEGNRTYEEKDIFGRYMPVGFRGADGTSYLFTTNKDGSIISVRGGTPENPINLNAVSEKSPFKFEGGKLKSEGPYGSQADYGKRISVDLTCGKTIIEPFGYPSDKIETTYGNGLKELRARGSSEGVLLSAGKQVARITYTTPDGKEIQSIGPVPALNGSPIELRGKIHLNDRGVISQAGNESGFEHQYRAIAGNMYRIDCLRRGDKEIVTAVHGLEGSALGPNGLDWKNGDINIYGRSVEQNMSPKELEAQVKKVMNALYDFDGRDKIFKECKSPIQLMKEVNERLKKPDPDYYDSRQLLLLQPDNRVFVTGERHRVERQMEQKIIENPRSSGGGAVFGPTQRSEPDINQKRIEGPEKR